MNQTKIESDEYRIDVPENGSYTGSNRIRTTID